MNAAIPQRGVDPALFRNVLGRFPTGVVIVTAMNDGEPTGMVVGSFTSVSLEPPLVAFLPMMSSTTFPKIRRSGAFAVNVVSAADEELCRAFAAKGTNSKFDKVSWQISAGGSPILEQAVAWIDCIIDSVSPAGDHYIVIGAVKELGVGTGEDPLLFYRGGYGRFDQGFRTAPGQSDILKPLRRVDRIRQLLEHTAADLGVECFANAVVGDELVIVGSTGESAHMVGTSRIGQRMPLVAPLGAGAVAWTSEAERRAWLQRASLSEVDRLAAAASLARVRQRGWSVALASDELLALEAAVGQQSGAILGGHEQDSQSLTLARHIAVDTHDPAVIDPETVYHVRNISAPVLAQDGELLLLLSLYGLPRQLAGRELMRYVESLRGTAASAAALLSTPALSAATTS